MQSAQGVGLGRSASATAGTGNQIHSQKKHNCGVLAVTPHEGDPNLLHACDVLSAHGYPSSLLALRNREQLTAALRPHGIQVLVMHTDLSQRVPLTELLQVRRQFPAVHWVLASQTLPPDLPQLVVKFQARACLDCDDSESFPRAIEAVSAGRFWFPRWLSHALYFRLLSTIDTAHPDAVPAHLDSDTTLTHREHEALDLMRQGLTNRDIAARLQVSVNTVKKHLKHALDKRHLTDQHQGRFRSVAAAVSLLAMALELLSVDIA